VDYVRAYNLYNVFGGGKEKTYLDYRTYESNALAYLDYFNSSVGFASDEYRFMGYIHEKSY
jgi:hypothetical protein